MVFCLTVCHDLGKILILLFWFWFFTNQHRRISPTTNHPIKKKIKKNTKHQLPHRPNQPNHQSHNQKKNKHNTNHQSTHQPNHMQHQLHNQKKKENYSWSIKENYNHPSSMINFFSCLLLLKFSKPDCTKNNEWLPWRTNKKIFSLRIINVNKKITKNFL